MAALNRPGCEEAASVDLAAGHNLMIKVAKTISLAEAPAMLTSLKQGSRLHGKAVIVF